MWASQKGAAAIGEWILGPFVIVIGVVGGFKLLRFLGVQAWNLAKSLLGAG